MNDLKIACPGCGQGWLQVVTIPTINTTLVSCEECDSTWTTVSAVENERAFNLMVFMKSHGLRGTADDLIIERYATRSLPDRPE